MNLTIGFKGQLKLNAQAVPLQEGYLKIGGIVNNSQTNGLSFGVVASVNPDDPDLFVAGTASGNVVRGIVVFDDAIAQNAPAHPGKYLAGMPASVLNHGFAWLQNWTKTATGAQDPALGCKVIFKDADGTIEFLPATAGSVPSGYTELTNVSVRGVDDNHGALIYIN